MTFNEEECYELFLAVDDRARELVDKPPALLALRERLLPAYRKRVEQITGYVGGRNHTTPRS